ncbi:MAG: SBBP repeat-containing protein [Bacteroidia bacterium]
MKPLYFFLLISSLTLNTNAQTLDWAIKMGGGGNGDEGDAIAVGSSGNVYTTGSFISTGDFDPGPGVFNLSAMGTSPTSRDIFISKVDLNGNFIWAKQIGGISGPDIANDLCIDKAENIYLTGYFEGIVDFDPGTGVYNLTATGSEDIFVCKLDSSGSFLWAKSMGGNGSAGTDLSNANEIAIDSAANIYITGFFGSTVDFDPGIGIFNLTAGGTRSIFICKLDSAGSFEFAKQFNGPGYSIGHSICVDVSGNIYSTGGYSQTTDFDPGPGIYNLAGNAYYDIYISKLDASGNFAWAKSMGSPVNNESGFDAATDASGNVYITGRFGSAFDFDPGVGVFMLTPAGYSDGFISKFDNAGNFIWAKQLTGTGAISPEALTLDLAGNIFLTGAFSGDIDFDPGAGIYNLNGSATDVFILNLNNNGSFNWAVKLASTFYSDAGYAIAVDPTGAVYTTGHFEATCDFDPGPGVFTLYTPNGAGGGAVFVHKMNSGLTALPIELVSFYGRAIEMQNILYWTTLSEINNNYFSLQRSRTGNNFETIGILNGAGNSTQKSTYSFTDAKPFMGINYYRLQQTDFNGEISFSKIIALQNPPDKFYELITSPNPAIDFINVFYKNLNANDEIIILNTLGETLIKTNKNKIDISGLQNGIYLVQIKTAAEKILNQKIIIQH